MAMWVYIFKENILSFELHDVIGWAMVYMHPIYFKLMRLR